MKKILFLLLTIVAFSSCKKDDTPYPTMLYAEDVKITNGAQTVTIPITTNAEIQEVIMDETVDWWCSFKLDGTNIVAELSANMMLEREASFTVKGVDRTIVVKIIQEEGEVNIDDFKEIDRSKWEVVGFCDEIPGDGGGAAAILEDGNETFWHNNWSNAKDVLPHWIIIDMKEDVDVDMIRLGWRKANGNYYYNNKVTNIYMGDTPEHDKITSKVGSLLTLPVGSSHASAEHKPYHDVGIRPSKARYLMLEVTESNNGQTSIIAYVKAYKYMKK